MQLSISFALVNPEPRLRSSSGAIERRIPANKPRMKLSIACVAIVVACIATANAQVGGPGAGWLIGQEASKNAVSFAISSSLAKNDPSALPPELQVRQNRDICAPAKILNFSLSPIKRMQEELQQVVLNGEVALAACDDFLLTSTFWRYKVCKFQELNKIRLQIQQLKIKAAAAAAAANSTADPSEANAGTVA